MKNKYKTKKRIDLIRFTTLLMGLLMFLFIFSACQKPAPTQAATELLSLGEKYMLELDYEQALVQFLKVIEIEPMNARAYMAAADAYLAMDEGENAIAVLQRGYDETGDPQVFLMELHVHYKTEGYEDFLNLMDKDEFSDMLEQIEQFPFIVTNNMGEHGIGIYEGGYIYIGDYKNELRNGYGIWIKRDSIPYRFEGEWANDLPNGIGAVKRSITMVFGSIIECYESGELVDGLWNGKTNFNYEYGNYIAEYQNGKRIQIGDELVSDDSSMVYPFAEVVAGFNDSSFVYCDFEELNSLHGILPFAELS